MTKVFEKKPLISIIVPVYKVEKYLNRCIHSIVNQTMKDLEIILVDDGSPDTCPKMCDDWAKKDKRIKVIHQKNKGLSAARNHGIKISKGKYIGFVDSDDYIDKYMYENMVSVLIKEQGDMCCCKLQKVYEKRNFLSKEKFTKDVHVYSQSQYMNKFFKIGSQECVYYATTKLYKREILCNNQYPVGKTAEDVLGTFKALMKCNKIVELDYPYYFYYINNNSITGSGFSMRDFDLLSIWDEIVYLCNKKYIQYIDYAELNRNRIDYTLLMRMAINVKYEDIVAIYTSKYINCLKRVKQNKEQLLHSNIPLLRKVTLILICMNYKLFCKICYKIKHL